MKLGNGFVKSEKFHQKKKKSMRCIITIIIFNFKFFGTLDPTHIVANELDKKTLNLVHNECFDNHRF